MNGNRYRVLASNNAASNVLSNVATLTILTVGDLTGNNRISIMDVALLRTHVMEMGHTLSDTVQSRIAQGAGDITGTGTLEIEDVVLLRTYVMGMGHTLPPSVQARLNWHAQLNQGV